MARENNDRTYSELNITINNDFDTKNYEKQIEKYLETLVKEFEKR
jgi:hypothetical protein